MISIQDSTDANRFSSPNTAPSKFDSERYQRAVWKSLKKRGFTNFDEIDSFIQDYLPQQNPFETIRKMEKDTFDIAQELAFQAMEAQSDDEKIKHSREALLHDPDCVDALVQVALLAETSYNDRITRIGDIAKKAKSQLGEEFFKSYTGHFWVVVESRPYMRTLKVLIDLLRSSGRGEESITICEQMLVLDPGDHEGVRDGLLGLYLKGGKVSEARGLIENWKNFPDAVLSWGRVLERFLSGDSVGASNALLFAIEMNPYVAAYLLGRKPKPKQIVDFFSVGDEDEARYCVYQVGEAWVSFPTALSWLASRLEEHV